MKYSAFYLEDNEELSEIICALLASTLRIDCLPLASFAAMVANLPDVLNTKIALLDLDLGANKPSGIDAFYWLQKNSFQGKVFFLTGHGLDNPLLNVAQTLGATILEKPVSIETIQKLFKPVLNRPNTGAEY